MIPSPPVSSYFDFFQDYFSSGLILMSLVLVIVSIAGLYLAFRFAQGSVLRSRLLLGMMFLSSSFWVFVISSVALCIALVQDYLSSPFAAIILVARLGLVVTAIAGPISFFALRRHALREVSGSVMLADSESFVSEDELGSETNRRVQRIFSALLSRVGIDPSVRLTLLAEESKLPVSVAFDYSGRKLVALKQNVVELLDDDELETVLAHELGHIKNRDSFQKTLATTLKMALLFDPVVSFVEAAFYREREFIADEYAGLKTGKPVSLAGALLKIYDTLSPRPSASPVSLSALLVSHSPGLHLLSKQPALELRIRRLLALAKST